MDPVGPLIPAHYVSEKITKVDVAIASTVFGVTLVWVGLCIWLALGQTKNARVPLRSTYIWMIWLELLVSTLMAIECWCYIMKWIPPSFGFYFTILFWWCIQVQLLLQIIINRVRVISLNKDRARWIMIGTAVIVTMINISVYNIWIPARLQINETYIRVNNIWDRIEKVIYLIMDAILNAYFIKNVRRNLVQNGLEKYNSLLAFNVRIIFVSLLMDVMIIAAMSIPNSFVYIQFHPLAYLVKLSIEMTMARLIRKIAISSARRNNTSNGRSARHEFVFNNSSEGSSQVITTTLGLSTLDHEGKYARFDYEGKGIKRTQEVTIESTPNIDLVKSTDQLNVEVRSTSSSSKDDGNSSSPDDLDMDEVPLGDGSWNAASGNSKTTVVSHAK